MQLFRRKARARLGQVLGGAQPPSLPTGVLRVLKLLREPESEIRDVAESISFDPGLVLRVLKLVNSSSFGLVSKVDDVHHAVNILGRGQLEQLVLGVAVKDSLPKSAVRGFEPGRFWQAAFFRASLARGLASRLHPVDQARCFTGALLQDMAVPVLAHARPADYGKALEVWHESPGVPLHEIEKQLIGCSHDEVGAHLAVEWDLPESLTSVIQHHHSNAVSDFELPPALRLVALLRETMCEHGIDALVELGKSQYGLEADWLSDAVAECTTHARELAGAMA